MRPVWIRLKSSRVENTAQGVHLCKEAAVESLHEKTWEETQTSGSGHARAGGLWATVDKRDERHTARSGGIMGTEWRLYSTNQTLQSNEINKKKMRSSHLTRIRYASKLLGSAKQWYSARLYCRNIRFDPTLSPYYYQHRSADIAQI